MTTRLYYYTGTGNSLWVTRQLARRLDFETELVSLGTDYEMPDAACERVGLIFPVHIWGVPRRVVDFVGRLTPLPSCYTFAVAVNAGQVAATLLQLQKLLAAKGIALGAGFDLKMPSNYIPWGGAQPLEEQETLFAKAEQKIDRVAEFVRRSENGWVERGPWWQNMLFSAINKLSFSRVPKMDKDFWFDEKCNGCGLCTNVCPAANILLAGGRPAWQGRCEQCLACLQWCPQEAVQYAKRTAEKKRYHHPDVSVEEMKAAANGRQ